jgi:integrase
MREGRWVLADLEGKDRRVRTVAIPGWVKQGINTWMTAACVEDGRLLRAVSKGGKAKESMSRWAVWSVVEQSAREIGIERFGAHDLRRYAEALPQERRKYRTDQVPARPLLHPDDQTLPRFRAGDRARGQAGRRANQESVPW